MVAETDDAAASVRWRGSSPPVKREMATGNVQLKVQAELDRTEEIHRDSFFIRCPNLNCPAQVKERMRYFASRNAMDIEGLGEVLVDQLVGGGLITTYGDLYRLQLDQLAGLERMGEKSSQNILICNQNSKSVCEYWTRHLPQPRHPTPSKSPGKCIG